MEYLCFNDNKKNFKYALLVDALNEKMIKKYYLNHLNTVKDHLICFDLFKQNKKTKASLQKEYFADLSENYLQQLNISTLIVCDTEYFKTITGVTKVDPSIGYVLKSKCHNYNVIYCPNYRTVFYNPKEVQNKISLCLKTFNDFIQNNYSTIGSNIIHNSKYLSDPIEIEKYLLDLINLNEPITADIETFSLKHYNAGLGTISFAWNQNEGIVIVCDLEPIEKDNENNYTKRINNFKVKQLLKQFFINFKNKIIWHNAAFDVYILIYELFMENDQDQKGLLLGLDIMTKNLEDTQIISYLALNTTAQYSLSLKSLSHEYSGNYSIDNITDIKKIPLDYLLKYNLIDALSTYYVFNKYFPKMIRDKQENIYRNILLPSLKDNIQMQLTGLPLNIDTVKKVKLELTDKLDKINVIINNSHYVKKYNKFLINSWVINKNKTLKKKQVTELDFPKDKESFNKNSSKHLIDILYGSDFMNLPKLDYTIKKNLSVSGNTLKKLVNSTNNQDIKLFLESLSEYKIIVKLLQTYIPAFELSHKRTDNWQYLSGWFKIGGTISGRLSSNLQQIPSSKNHFTTKLIKSCFEAPKGYLLIGADFNALEARISALQTKDPEKLKVYLDGFDSHCLNAYAYYKDQMKNIDPTKVGSINSIKNLYPELRQSSKNVTFACTYAGTHHTLHKNLGIPLEQAKQIEKAYTQLYKHSINWVNSQLKQAAKNGFAELAFGLRLRTPLLKQTILNNSKTPLEASAEGRTVGNALGQSYGLLNDRAMSEFMNKVRNSQFALMIKPIAKIHDAVYFLIKDDLDCVKFVNDNLIKAMEWQDDPAIYHDKVKLGGELSVFYPNWSKECTIPNYISEPEIKEIFKNYLKDSK